MKYSTYSAQPTAIVALPAHAVIQYDQALANLACYRTLLGRTRTARRQPAEMMRDQLRQDWAGIQALAARLVADGTVSGREAFALLKRECPGSGAPRCRCPAPQCLEFFEARRAVNDAPPVPRIFLAHVDFVSKPR